MRFITRLNTFACVWAHACAIARLSWKSLLTLTLWGVWKCNCATKFGLLYKLWERLIKVTLWFGVTLIDRIYQKHRVTLINLLCKFTSKGHFYPKNKFQEVTEKNICSSYIQQECRDIVLCKFKYWNFRKTLKINQSNPVSW